MSRTLAILALCMLAATDAAAANRNWNGGSATWDDVTTGNWVEGAVPVAGDIVYIQQAGVTVGYTATPVTAPGFSQFYIQHTAAATTSTFTLDGSDHLRVNTLISIGQFVAGDTVFNLGDTATLDLNGANAIRLGSGGGTATFNQTGGTFNNGLGPGCLFIINSGGTYDLSNGTVNANRGLTVGAGGTWNQTGGAANWQLNPISVAGEFNLSNGNFNHADFILSGSGSVNWTGGTIAQVGAGGRLNLNGAGSSWTQKGGTLTINVSAVVGANTLIVVPGATIQGYGTIQDQRYGASSPGTFSHSGRIIANGYGADNTLDMSRYGQTPTVSKLVNPTDNTTTNGWFATDHGKLLLPAVGVGAGDSTVNWGEAAGDTTIDLVNSVRATFTGASAANLTGALLASDHGDVPSGLYKPAGIWSLGGITATGTTITFRYDDASAAAQSVAEADLKVWKHDGAAWVDVTGSRDETANTITSSDVGSLAAATYFAVAPELPMGPVIWIR